MLVGHSTDSVGFSLSALVTLMSPTQSTVANGIFYLGLMRNTLDPCSGPFQVHEKNATT